MNDRAAKLLPQGPWASLTARDALAMFAKRALSPVELVRDTLQRIDEQNPLVNAFAYVDHAGALDQAKASEARWMAGVPLGPLDGVPLTVKDLTLVAGMPTRFGSLSSDPEPFSGPDAPVVGHLRRAGAIILGKTTTSEFGWKAITDTLLHGVTRNPRDLTLTPGGSSGGAGVAAYLNLGLLHLGSDAGGSIRIPASFTSTFGFKPTFGTVPQWPASLMGQLSHLGPMTRSVGDAALMMSVIAQSDPRDGYASHAGEVGWTDAAVETLKGLRVAYSPDLGYVSVEPSIAACVKNAVLALEKLGAVVEEVSPDFQNPISAFETLFLGGLSQLTNRLAPARLQVLEPGLRAEIDRGRALSLQDYLAAERSRERLIAHMQQFHQKFDLLVTPTLPISPFDSGRLMPNDSGMEKWFEWAPFSYPFNLSQQPAASLPCGLDHLGKPVGIQIVGPRFSDLEVLQAAQLLEGALGK